MKQQTAEADDPAAHSSPVWQQARQTSGARFCCEWPGRARGKCKTCSTKKNNQQHWAKRQKTFCMLTSRKDSSTTVHPTSAGRSSDTTGSPSLSHASCPTQAKGWWSRVSSVRLGLCRMQATRWQATATEMLLPLCETRSERKRNKKTGETKQKIINGRRSKNKIDATTDTTKRKFCRSKTPNFISQGPDTASCCFLPRLLQSILRRRCRFGYSTAQHKSALTHHD